MSWDDKVVLEDENLAKALKIMRHEEKGYPIGAFVEAQQSGEFDYRVRITRFVTKKDYKKMRALFDKQRKDYTEELSPTVNKAIQEDAKSEQAKAERHGV